MAFNDIQTKALKAKLSRKHVKTRSVDGVVMPYIEGWHAIQEANRIFGFDNWDRITLNPQCIFAREGHGQWSCLYQTKVRICVRAGDVELFRDGVGTGFAREATAEAAHELALKSAEIARYEAALMRKFEDLLIKLDYRPATAAAQRIEYQPQGDAEGSSTS